MFRIAMGIGGILGPLLGAATYSMGGFMAAFMVLGVGQMVITPFIFF